MSMRYMSQDEVNKLLDFQSTPRQQQGSFCSSQMGSLQSIIDPSTTKNEMSFGKARCYLDTIDDLRRQLDAKDKVIEEMEQQQKTRSSLGSVDAWNAKKYESKIEEMMIRETELLMENKRLSTDLLHSRSELKTTERKLELYICENKNLMEQKKLDRTRMQRDLKHLEILNQMLLKQLKQGKV